MFPLPFVVPKLALGAPSDFAQSEGESWRWWLAQDTLHPASSLFCLTEAPDARVRPGSGEWSFGAQVFLKACLSDKVCAHITQSSDAAPSIAIGSKKLVQFCHEICTALAVSHPDVSPVVNVFECCCCVMLPSPDRVKAFRPLSSSCGQDWVLVRVLFSGVGALPRFCKLESVPILEGMQAFVLAEHLDSQAQVKAVGLLIASLRCIKNVMNESYENLIARFVPVEFWS